MLRIRQDQLDALQAHANTATAARLLDELRQQGVIAAQETTTGDLLIADKRGLQTRMTFDSQGLPEVVQTPLGNRQRFVRNEQNKVAAVVHPGGQRWLYRYGTDGLLARLEVEGHATYELDYDEWGHLCAVTYPDKKKESFERSHQGELLLHKARSGALTTSIFHEWGERRRDALERAIDYHVAETGALERVDFPDGSSESYAFDSDIGQMTVVQRSGQTIACRTDSNGTPREISWEDGGELALKYDGLGRLASARNDVDEVRLSYTADGQLAEEATRAGTVTHSYDLDGRPIRLTTHDGSTVRYRYDEDGRLAGLEAWDGQQISIQPSLNGPPLRVSFPNGVTESWRVSGEPVQLESTLTTRSGSKLSRQKVVFNSCDRVCNVTDQWGTEGTDKLVRRLDYDDEFRLTGVKDVMRGKELARYAYDAVGNLIDDNGTTSTFGPMDNPVERGGVSIAYDALGNLTHFSGAAGLVRLKYTADSRLRSATVGRRVTRYAYDGLCRRVRKSDGITTWTYGWAGFQLLWEEVNTGAGSRSVRRDYIYLPGSVVPLGFREEGRAYWIQADHRGAVIAVHDDRGQLVWRGVYDSFGHVRAVVNKVRQPWRFAGQYFDDETGLHYNTVRYYSPELKSYLSLDPRWQEPEGTKYSYGRNDPWNRADPIGMLAPLVLGAIVVGAAGLISGAIAAYNAPDGEGLSAFGKGFAVGAGAALVGIGATLALPSLGVTAAGLVGLVTIGALEGAVASILDDIINKRDICIDCMLTSASTGAALGLLLPGVGGFLGRQASRFVPAFKPILSKPVDQLADPTSLLRKQAIGEAKKDISSHFVSSRKETERFIHEATSGELGIPGQVVEHRNKSSQSRVSSGTGEDAGHRIGNRFGAPGDETNLARQNWKANRFGTFKNLENEWEHKLKNGVRIKATVTDVFQKGDNRPMYRIAEWEEILPDGSLIKRRLDFGNFHTAESRAAQNVASVVKDHKDNVLNFAPPKKHIIGSDKLEHISKSRLSKAAVQEIREAIKLLKQNGVSVYNRKEILRGFELETLKVERLKQARNEYRAYHGMGAEATGRWSSPDHFSSPEERIVKLALVNNQATRIAQVELPEGSTVLTGIVAPQTKVDPKLIGGARQTFFINSVGKRVYEIHEKP